jgi:putative ABC transport system permease protein
MNLFSIALRSIRQRGLASMLTCFSMALGVTLMVAVIAIHGVVNESFKVGQYLGYNILVGPKGGKLQLTLNSVYYLDEPIENIPYDYYLEFATQDQREADFKHSLQQHAHDIHWELMRGMQQAMGTSLASGTAGLVTQLATAAVRLDAEQSLPGKRIGQFAGPFTYLAIPLLLGDYYESFRVVGTTPDMFGTMKYGPSADRQYEFSSGRNFKTHSKEHGFFEAVVGSVVARQTNLHVGDKINPRHGAVDGHTHNQPFTVVGILDSTGTPNDRAVFVNMEGFYLMADHAKPVEETESEEDEEEDAEDDHEEAFDTITPLPIEQREVTAVLLQVDPIFSFGLPNQINEGPVAQAVYPIREINKFFGTFIGPVLGLLVVITLMICIVSGVGILVSIYNSMSDRRHEIAVLRALGAERSTVLWIILFESLILSITGGLIGWILGHGVVACASPIVESKTGVAVGFFDLAPALPPYLPISPELLLVPLLAILAIAVGLIPAMAAYRTDVSQSLGK